MGERCIQDLANVIARSQLRKFDTHLENEEDRIHILESIQWEHIRDLTIRMEEECLPRDGSVVDGIEKLSGIVEVERFELYYETLAASYPLHKNSCCDCLLLQHHSNTFIWTCL